MEEREDADDDPRPVTKYMLVGLVETRVQEAEPDFTDAKKMADKSAGEVLATAFLLAWFDGKTWTHSPAIC